MKKKHKRTWIVSFAAAGIAAVLLCTMFWLIKTRNGKNPEEILVEYMSCIQEQEYEKMYELIDPEVSQVDSKEMFLKRNQAIYEGIEMQNMTVEIQSSDPKKQTVTYLASFDTAAGPIAFEHTVYFRKGSDGYRLVWNDAMIFPDLEAEDKVRVFTESARRGKILDRNGQVLAGPGTAVRVGVVPGKMKDRKTAVEQLAKLLDLKPAVIEKKLAAKWVKEDSFVPVATIPKVKELDLLTVETDAKTQEALRQKEALLAIPGVMLSEVSVREYPLGAAAAHLVGYLQTVTAEDLQVHPNEGYSANSMIGRSGMEGLYEKELKGMDGCRIFLVDGAGREKKELANRPVVYGTDVRLTIDAKLQKTLYEQFQEDKSCSVAMDPNTGEVLALVSTPSYDSNAFIFGMSDRQWKALNEDEGKPLYNRFRQVWCPGSSFKPITAAVGLETGTLDPKKDYGGGGLRWQKDSSWGSYYVTTLHETVPANLKNALINSDNIYFAKAALRIGAAPMEQELAALGFGTRVPFEIQMAASRYSNTEHIESEVQLADSGYGQGQILINPLHLASLYTAFCNDGTALAPSLRWEQGASAREWLPEAFSKETADEVLEGLKAVVNDPHGTGYGACRQERILAGKTGTAEIKASKGDTSGTELGWFVVFTTEKDEERPILLVTMAEDVKGRGGSGYVVKKTAAVLDRWFS